MLGRVGRVGRWLQSHTYRFSKKKKHKMTITNFSVPILCHQGLKIFI